MLQGRCECTLSYRDENVGNPPGIIPVLDLLQQTMTVRFARVNCWLSLVLCTLETHPTHRHRHTPEITLGCIASPRFLRQHQHLHSTANTTEGELLTNVIPSSSQIPTPPHHTLTCLALRHFCVCMGKKVCVPVPVCVFMLRVNYRGTATTRHPCVQSPFLPKRRP